VPTLSKVHGTRRPGFGGRKMAKTMSLCFLSAVGSNVKLIYTAKPDTTKQSFQCRVRLRRCELDPRQLKTVAGRKFEV